MHAGATLLSRQMFNMLSDGNLSPPPLFEGRHVWYAHRQLIYLPSYSALSSIKMHGRVILSGVESRIIRMVEEVDKFIAKGIVIPDYFLTSGSASNSYSY